MNFSEDEPSFVEKTLRQVGRIYRKKIDKYVLNVRERWIFTISLGLLYLLRVLYNGGFYVVSYVLGLYILHALVQFLTPLGMPDADDEDEDTIYEDLPTTKAPSDSSYGKKPLIRSVSEFNLWQGVTIALVVGNIVIVSSLFDLPVFWPFLLGYFIFLVYMTIKKQIRHMKRHGYSIFDFGKKGATKE